MFHDIQFSQGDCLFDSFMGVEVHDKKRESSVLGASQVETPFCVRAKLISHISKMKKLSPNTKSNLDL